MSEDPSLSVPERRIPVPTSVSPEAQNFLGMGGSMVAAAQDYPEQSDLEAWRALAAQGDEMITMALADRPGAELIAVEHREVAGVGVFELVPNGTSPEDRRICLDIHGGAFIMGGGDACRVMAVPTAQRFGLRTWSVDYRMPPEHPYPASLDDCLAVYRALLGVSAPADIVLNGTSAGGNLAAAMLMRARDEGLPLPAAVVLCSPELDLTESGDSFSTNLGLDSVLTRRLMPVNLLYAGGADLMHPYLSPLFGDLTQGFPPALLQAGTRDLFLSNAVRMHRALLAADVEAELHVFEAMPHGGFFGAPEDRELDASIRRFVDKHIPRS